MKRVISVIFVISVILAFYAFNENKNNGIDSAIFANAEALSSVEFPSNVCYNGGPGASSCSIEAGINVFGFGTSIKCEVKCRDGFYACCGLRCTCERES